MVHQLDHLRAHARLNHTLVDRRGERHQRIQSVVYYHGLAQRHGLMTGENRRWREHTLSST
jgi:hypothetical protein